MQKLKLIRNVQVKGYQAAVVVSRRNLSKGDMGRMIKHGVEIDGQYARIVQIENMYIDFPYPAGVQFTIIFNPIPNVTGVKI